jgi:queuosine biosynthesis protein QueD
MKIGRTYRFEAAHRLDLLPETHKCHNLHGHNYRMEVTIFGVPNRLGFIMDFADLDAVVNPLVEKFDHKFLNDIADLGPSTAENIARNHHRTQNDAVHMANRWDGTQTPHQWKELPLQTDLFDVL